MAHQPLKKEKPPVPPKPSHLTCSEKPLPRPPDKFVDVNEVDDSYTTQMKDERHHYYGDDGYLSPVGGQNIGDQITRNGVKKVNLGGRLSNEMADLSASVKQKMFKSISFRFPSSRREADLESISEEPENFSADVRQRPLPLLPGEKGENVMGLPWFCLVDRRKAEDMVAEARDGTFLIRPSSKGQHSYALTLWYKERAYNIPIRKRQDGKFALGTPKDLEQSFTSIEVLLRNYQREELVLFSNGVENGRTLLYPLSG